MCKQHGGAIIITSSGHAFSTYPNCSAYAATKGGHSLLCAASHSTMRVSASA